MLSKTDPNVCLIEERNYLSEMKELHFIKGPVPFPFPQNYKKFHFSPLNFVSRINTE